MKKKPYGTSVIFLPDVADMIRTARSKGFPLTFIANESIRCWFRQQKFKKTKMSIQFTKSFQTKERKPQATTEASV